MFRLTLTKKSPSFATIEIIHRISKRCMHAKTNNHTDALPTNKSKYIIHKRLHKHTRAKHTYAQPYVHCIFQNIENQQLYVHCTFMEYVKRK